MVTNKEIKEKVLKELKQRDEESCRWVSTELQELIREEAIDFTLQECSKNNGKPLSSLEEHKAPLKEDILTNPRELENY